jgi:hypothetical protein
MLTLHIESTSIEDLCMQARGFIQAYGLPKTAVLVTDQVAEKPAEPKTKVGRPKKEETTLTVTPAPAPAPAPPTPVSVNPFDDAPEVMSSKAVTLEDVRSALQEVAVKYPGDILANPAWIRSRRSSPSSTRSKSAPSSPRNIRP